MVTSNLNLRGSDPGGALRSVDEVSDVAVMLAANGYITGQTINVKWVVPDVANGVNFQLPTSNSKSISSNNATWELEVGGWS